jgi:hypothetical protein
MNAIDQQLGASLREADVWSAAIAALLSKLQASSDAAADASGGAALWWGGDIAGLQAHWRCPETLPLRLADADGRRLKRSAQALASQQPQLTRLLQATSLRQDTARLNSALERTSVRELEQYLALQESLHHAAEQAPTVASDSLALLVADFLLNSHGTQADASAALAEALRTLRRGGRVLCPLLLADEPVGGRHVVRGLGDRAPLTLPTETACLAAFEAAGFHGMTLHVADTRPVDRVEGADVRLWLMEAFKGKQGPCWELGQAVIYRGPWREVRDDDGHVYARGSRVAVCAKTFELLHRAPYAEQFVGLRAEHEPALAQAAPFDCNTPALRHPKVTKGLQGFAGEAAAGNACEPGSGCC